MSQTTPYLVARLSILVFSVTAILSTWTNQPALQASEPSFRGAIVATTETTENRLKELKSEGFNALAIVVEGATEKQSSEQRRAAQLVMNASLDLYYWIEVARSPALADKHPEWMASLQTHDKWRRFFPKTRQPTANEVVKTYPWVPILSREPFAAQLQRIKKLLAPLPKPRGLFLNDLQGAPSACGCGNPLCRWTSDYGKRRTTIPLGDDAATLFANAVRKYVPESLVIPVWTTECEKHDGSADGLCAGVGCFDGICWNAYTRQLGPLQQSCDRLGVLVPYRAFQRDLKIYGEEAGWISHAVRSFSTMPPKHAGKPVQPQRLITVLQGWDVSPNQIKQQIRVASAADVYGYLVSYSELEQHWEPRVIQWRSGH